MFGYWKRRRRAAILEQPFPDTWSSILERNVPWARRLADDDRAELEKLIQVFVAEKSWEGCGGLELADEHRVTIAAAACRLVLHHDAEPYPELQVVRVYPSAFVVHARRRDGHALTEGPEVRTGESWERGVVVLAWDAVKRGARDPADGHDVATHEFAHQLDQSDGRSDGAPPLPDAGAYRAWAGALGRAYAQLSADIQAGRKPLIDPYGATSPAEFFAVATEHFFERPGAMKKRDPELYAVLAGFYQQDPAA